MFTECWRDADNMTNMQRQQLVQHHKFLHLRQRDLHLRVHLRLWDLRLRDLRAVPLRLNLHLHLLLSTCMRALAIQSLHLD